jgi:hypothetical protein
MYDDDDFLEKWIEEWEPCERCGGTGIEPSGWFSPIADIGLIENPQPCRACYGSRGQPIFIKVS